MNQAPTQISNVNQLVLRIASIGSVVIYMLVGLAVIYIIWTVVQYLVKGKEGDESRHQAGMQVFWGVVGLAVIVSLWGLVNLLLNTFSVNSNRPNLPSANFLSNSSGNGANSNINPVNP